MAGQSVTKNLNDEINILNFSVKDSQGNAAQGCTLALNIISGDATGLTLLQPAGVTGYRIQCNKVGTYHIELTASNAAGSLTTDAAGDTDGTQDTITVQEPPPASMSWTYA